jgi:hypothetical protein
MIKFSDVNKDVVNCIVANPRKGSHCFWDRHIITSDKAVVCPIRYKPKQIVKIYKSEISNDVYTIKENVPSDLQTGSFKVINEQYETDGLFCSLNCCLAFIKDNKHDIRYNHSEVLLYKNLKQTIVPAPHWRTLIEYGGTLTIKEFRKFLYTYQGNDYTLEEGEDDVRSTCYLYTKVVDLKHLTN